MNSLEKLKSKQITKKYKNIYNFFFNYFIFFLILCISVIFVFKILNQKITLDIKDTFSIEKVKIIGDFNKKLNQNTTNKDINIFIINGIIESDENTLLSSDNLISYKGFIMPRNVFLYHMYPIEYKEYFTGNYNIKELESFLRHIIFTNIKSEHNIQKSIVSLPIEDTIENTFYINCVNHNKILNKSCQHYIKNFIKYFYIYNIDKDYDGLIHFFDRIKKTKYKNEFCENIKKYTLYSQNTNNKLESIFIYCGLDYHENFKNLSFFLDINNQLNKGYIDNSIYQNKNLNAYKLISYQQIIYNDLNQNIINNIRFDSYINYIKAVLKTNNLDNFYFDLTYLFNNNYIINTLNSIKYKVSERKKIEIENIIKNLIKINNGDNLEGYIGLNEIIVNKNLKTETTNYLKIFSENNERTNNILSNLKSLSFLRIISESLLDDKIKINGYLSVKINEGVIPIYLGFIIKNINNQAIIETINISEYKELNQTISNIIKQKNYTITEVYQYIQNNIHIFLSKDKISTCELISNKIEKIKENNKNINHIDLASCDTERINILKEEKIKNETVKVYYKINLENFNIKDIIISDKQIEFEIKKYLQNINTNHITIPNIISEIVSFKLEEKSNKQEGSSKTIMAIEDFERFLSTMPKDIVEKGETVTIEFSIKNITFIGNYDLRLKKLGPLSFKYNKQNDEPNNNPYFIKEEDLIVDNFKIYLKEEEQNNINDFLINPINYIKKINPSVVENYEKLQYK